MISSQGLEGLKSNEQATKNNISFSLYILILAIGLYFFLTLFWTEYYVIWTFLLIFSDLIYLLIKKKIILSINLNVIIWGLFILICILGIVNPNTTTMASGSLFHVLTILLLYFNFILLMGEKNWEYLLLKIILTSSWVFIIGAIIQLISPSLLQSINQIQLDTEQYISFNNFMRWGYIVGFSSNPGITAFAISPVTLNSFIKIFEKNNFGSRLKNFFLFLLGFVLIVMTGKRGMTLIILIIVAYLAFILTKKKIFAIVPMTLFILFLIFLIFNTESGQDLIIRTMSQDDLTTGRAPMYNIMWQKFLNHPIIGIGTYSINNFIVTKNGHNIYLQVLSENGIVAFLLLLFILLFNLFKTHLLLYRSNAISHKTILGFSISQQIVFILWGITGNTLYDRYSLVIYFIAIAITWIMSKNSKNEKILKTSIQ